MVHHNILTLSPYTLFLSPHPSPTPSFIASPSSSYSFLHCFIALPSPYSLLPSPYSFLHCHTLLPLLLSFIASLPHPSPTLSFIASPSSPYSFLHYLTLLLYSFLYYFTPLLLPSLPHPPPLLLSSLLH